MSKRRVVVTGLGIINSAGIGEQEVWNKLCSGKPSIGPVKSVDVSASKTKIGAEVDSARMAEALLKMRLKPEDRTTDLGLIVAAQALEQAGLLASPDNSRQNRMATLFGTAGGSAHSLFRAYMSYAEKGVRGPRPTTIPRCMASALSSQISMKFHLYGANYVVVSACAAATTAIGLAYRMISEGHAESVLCGGSDATFEPTSYASWDNLGVMTRNPDPEKACRPFDAARDGMILGEGAAALVLETPESALARGAKIRAEIAGYGESSDAEHITHPSPAGQAEAMRMAMDCAGAQPSDIAFINAHGTATRANDECESDSIRRVLGAATDEIPVSACKGHFGHLLGASGAAETLVTVLCLETGSLPPNLNLDNPAPECNLCFDTKSSRVAAKSCALKNSFGFGGNNAVLVLRRWT